MKWLVSRTFWGTLLILGGIVLLLENLNIVALGDIFWAAVFCLAAYGFLSVFLKDRRHWWALIPGMTMLSIAVIILMEFLFPAAEDILGGSVMLGGIGLGFWLTYLANRENWWAIIPGGVLFTLAVVASLDEAVTGISTGGVFMLGMGLTFALVALLPTPQGRMKWAWIPACVLALIGVFIMAAYAELINYVWPLLLIVLGIYLVLRNFFSRR